MRDFFDEQGRTRVCAEAYSTYAAGENLRRTPLIGKRTIYGWKPITSHKVSPNAPEMKSL